MQRRIVLTTLALSCAVAIGPLPGSAVARRLSIDDYFGIAAVSEPRMSPDGMWVAYTVTTSDLEEDQSSSQIWVVPTSGGKAKPLTSEDSSASHPRWSPDGTQLAFLSDRKGDKNQIWLLPMAGGEARQITDTAQGIGATVWFYDDSRDPGAFEWSPDGKRLVVVLKDASEEELAAKAAIDKGEEPEAKSKPPWVITRQQFKLDYVGYLDDRFTHLHLLDIESGALSQLTTGKMDDLHPAWSPDGRSIAFASHRASDPDADYNSDIWVIELDDEGNASSPVAVSTNPGMDDRPVWSLDGSLITHIASTQPELLYYATSYLAVSPVDGRGTQVLTEELDRNISYPRFSADGESLYFLVEDSAEQHLARMSAAGGPVERLVTGPQVVSGFDLGPDGKIATLIGKPSQPEEIHLFDPTGLQQLTFTNRELFADIDLGEVLEVQFKSKDGTEIEGFIIKPVGFEEGHRYPTVLRIHGGPQSQYDHGFHFEGQLYAANGYLVVMPNPRGSTGYGQDFCMAIWQDWGGPDFDDVMAAVDDAIERGWADPDRLAVTGWSYGGILTNHVIVKTDRFKAAATGASSALNILNYGVDQYQRWWEYELGLPWEEENRSRWDKISPFYDIENVVTPTLILGGEKDWNVPIVNSEQLFLALKRLGVETRLVVYPGEAHGGFSPQHEKDTFERYLDWFGKFLENE